MKLMDECAPVSGIVWLLSVVAALRAVVARSSAWLPSLTFERGPSAWRCVEAAVPTAEFDDAPKFVHVLLLPQPLLCLCVSFAILLRQLGADVRRVNPVCSCLRLARRVGVGVSWRARVHGSRVFESLYRPLMVKYDCVKAPKD